VATPFREPYTITAPSDRNTARFEGEIPIVRIREHASLASLIAASVPLLNSK